MSRNKAQDATSRKILALLRERYMPGHPDAEIEVYRYNSASIRVRIVAPHFADVPRSQRDKEIWPLLRKQLPDDTLSQISLLLLLTPDEQGGSLMNHEFEAPTPSRL